MAVIGELATLITARTAGFEHALQVASQKTISFSKTLNSTLDKLGPWGEGLRGAGRELQAGWNILSGFTSGMVSLGTTLAGQILTWGKWAAAAGAGLAVLSVKKFADWEREVNKLGLAIGDIPKAFEMMRSLDQTPLGFLFDDAEVAAAARALTLYGMSADQVQKTMLMLGHIASATGSNLADLADLVGRASSHGRLELRDLNKFQSQSLDMLKELGDYLGFNRIEMEKLVESGKISFDDLYAMLGDMTQQGGKFFGAMDVLANDTKGKWQQFTDEIGDLLRDLGGELVQTFDLRGLLQGLTSFIGQYRESVITVLKDLLMLGAQGAIAFARALNAAVDVTEEWMAVVSRMPGLLGATEEQREQIVASGRARVLEIRSESAARDSVLLKMSFLLERMVFQQEEAKRQREELTRQLMLVPVTM